MVDLQEYSNKEGFDISALISDIVNNKVSLFEVMRSAPDGDYWAHIQIARLSFTLMREPEVLKSLMSELNQKIDEFEIDESKTETIEKELLRKDGSRRFDKMLGQRKEALINSPSFLSGTCFESCLEQYKELISHVEKLWDSACQLYKANNFPMCAFISILVIEEIGKLSHLSQELISYDIERSPQDQIIVDRNHRRKHFIGVVSGALINSRLDRVLGKQVVRKLLHEAESDELEKTRQSCLYVDFKDGQSVVPSQLISKDRAKTLVVLAGELMAEVLGHFPWEFERMIEAVIAFEREIGMPEEKILRK